MEKNIKKIEYEISEGASISEVINKLEELHYCSNLKFTGNSIVRVV